MSRKAMLLAVTGLCGLALTTPLAKANVAYDFKTTSASGGDLDAPPFQGAPFKGVSGLSLIVTDAAYLSGALHFSLVQCGGVSGCGTVTGDPAGFVSFYGWDRYGSLSVNVSFLGNTIEGSISEASGSDDIRLSSSGTTWSGILLGTDNVGQATCNVRGSSIPPCSFAGSFVARDVVPDPQPVPEPASLALLGVGALALGLGRRGARQGITADRAA